MYATLASKIGKEAAWREMFHTDVPVAELLFTEPSSRRGKPSRMGKKHWIMPMLMSHWEKQLWNRWSWYIETCKTVWNCLDHCFSLGGKEVMGTTEFFGGCKLPPGWLKTALTM